MSAALLKACKGLLQVLSEAEIDCRFASTGGCAPWEEPCEMCAARAAIADAEKESTPPQAPEPEMPF